MDNATTRVLTINNTSLVHQVLLIYWLHFDFKIGREASSKLTQSTEFSIKSSVLNEDTTNLIKLIMSIWFNHLQSV